MPHRIVLPTRLGTGMYGEGLQGLIDAHGREVLAPKNVHVGRFHDGRAAVGVDYEHYGFVDALGRWVIEPRFHRVGTFAEGRCLVCTRTGNVERWAFVDETGAEVFPFDRPTFHDSIAFSENRLAVTRGGKVGFRDRAGNLVISHQFDQALPFREGLAPACLSERWGMIDLDGRWAVEPRWQRAFCFQDGVAIVVSAGLAVDSPFLRAWKKDLSVEEFRGRWGLVDREGAYVHPPAFDYVETEIGTTMTYVDRGVFGPTRFVEGHAIVREGGRKWGLLRRDGTLPIPPSLERIGEASEGLALGKKKVKGKSLWGVLDLEGAWVIAPRWESVLWPLARFSHGTCPVGAPVTAEQQIAFRAVFQYPTHATGYVDRAGEWTIPARFWVAHPFDGELAWVGTEAGWGWIERSGDVVWEALF